MYAKLNKFLKSETSIFFKDYNTMNELSKKRCEDIMLEYLIASWISNEKIDIAKKYVIDENNENSTGIDVVFFNKKTLYLIQVKNTANIKSGQYNKSKAKAEEINKTLTDPFKTKEEKQKLTGINSKIIDWLEERNWIYNYEFLFIYNSEKTTTLSNWPMVDEVKNHLLRIIDFFKKVVLEINTGSKIVTDVKHVLNQTTDEAKNTIIYKDSKNKGIIFPIKGTKLISILKDEIRNGNTLDSLFEGNVRYKVKKNIINSEIKESLRKNESNFFLLNNGITVLVNNLIFNKERTGISFENCNIINGQQTVRSLYELYETDENILLENIKILIKVYELNQQELEIKIPFASNNQNKIDVKDLMSLKIFNKNVKEALIKKDIFYISKKGISKVNEVSKFFDNSITSEELIKLFAICYDKKVTVKNSLNKMLEEVYTNIGKGELRQSNNYYQTEETILSLEHNNRETIKKMEKLVYIYTSLKAKKFQNIWKQHYPKSFDVINYVFYMFLKFEKDDFIEKFLNERFEEIFNLLAQYFKKEMSKRKVDELDYFRFKENWKNFCEEIEKICLENEDFDTKISLLKNYLIGFDLNDSTQEKNILENN